MPCRDLYGATLTTGTAAADAYNSGVRELLALRTGALAPVAASLAHDPTFALGHAALALLGHELCAAVDVAARLRDAERHAARSTTARAEPRARGGRPRARRLAPAAGRTWRPTRATPCCCPSRSRPSPSPGSPTSPARPGRSSSGRSRRTATTGGSPGCWPSSARSRAASTRRWSSPAARWRSSRPPGTRRTPGPTRTTRPATTRPAWPGWTSGSTGRARAATGAATSPGTPRCTS